MAKILTLIILIDKEVNLFKKVVDAALKWTIMFHHIDRGGFGGQGLHDVLLVFARTVFVGQVYCMESCST